MDWMGLEIRTGSTDSSIQSVFPPSKHHSGVQYRWVQGLSPAECDPVALPENIVAQIINNPDGAQTGSQERPRASDIQFEEVGEGERNDKLFRYACMQAGMYGSKCQLPDQFAHIVESVRGINKTQCKPPLPLDEVDRIVDSAVNTEMKKISAKVTQNSDRATARTAAAWGLEWDATTGEWFPGDWSLTVVDMDPPEYLLTVPNWERLTGGKPVTVGADTYNSPDKMARAILSATKCIIVDRHPGHWAGMWNGSKSRVKDDHGRTVYHEGLKSKLAMNCKFVDGAPVDKMNVQISEYVMIKLASAKTNQDDDSPRPQASTGTLRNDGTVWFVWNKFFEDGFITRKYTKTDLSAWRREVLKLTGGEEGFKKYPTSGPGRTRYFVINDTLKGRIEAYLDRSSNEGLEEV